MIRVVQHHRERGREARTTRLAPYAFLAPALLLFVCLLLVPIGYAAYLSLMQQQSSGGAYGLQREVFVGLDNYRRAVANPSFVESLGRLGIFTVLSVPAMMIASLVFALALDTYRVRLARFTRLSIFLPYAVPGVIATLMWAFLYLPSTSPANAWLKSVGLPPIQFLELPTIYASLANIAFWAGVGFNMIILFTALRALPAELYEAARLDGASEWQIAWQVKTPLVRPALILTGLFALIATLQTYSEPQTLKTLTDTIGYDFFPLMQIYRQAFATDDLNGAAASSLILSVGGLAVSLAIVGAGRMVAKGNAK